MNHARRRLIGCAREHLSDAASSISRAKDEEETCLQNVPESFEGTDRYQNMEDAVDNLEDALASIQEACAYLDSILG